MKKYSHVYFLFQILAFSCYGFSANAFSTLKDIQPGLQVFDYGFATQSGTRVYDPLWVMYLEAAASFPSGVYFSASYSENQILLGIHGLKENCKIGKDEFKKFILKPKVMDEFLSKTLKTYEEKLPLKQSTENQLFYILQKILFQGTLDAKDYYSGLLGSASSKKKNSPGTYSKEVLNTAKTRILHSWNQALALQGNAFFYQGAGEGCESEMDVNSPEVQSQPTLAQYLTLPYSKIDAGSWAVIKPHSTAQDSEVVFGLGWILGATSNVGLDFIEKLEILLSSPGMSPILLYSYPVAHELNWTPERVILKLASRSSLEMMPEFTAVLLKMFMDLGEKGISESDFEKIALKHKLQKSLSAANSDFNLLKQLESLTKVFPAKDEITDWKEFNIKLKNLSNVQHYRGVVFGNKNKIQAKFPKNLSEKWVDLVLPNG